MRLPRRTVGLVLAILWPVAVARAQNIESGVLRGVVVATEAGFPLEHAMVTVTAAQRQTFTSDNGAFVFAGLQPGHYRVRVAHLGYTPVEIDATVPAGGTPASLRIGLQRISVNLPAVNVTAEWACKNPGPPDPVRDPEFAAVIGQLKLNAEQYQLLADSFPFAYRFHREDRATSPDSADWLRSTDSVTFRSDAQGWQYSAGKVVTSTKDRGHEMHIPALRDFASPEFLDSHCFRYGGHEATKTGPALRIDFVAGDAIKSPDVNGTILLDAGSFQIRRTTLNLSRIPRELDRLKSVVVQTSFAEIAPYILVFNEIKSTNTYKPNESQFKSSEYEVQTLSQIFWLRSAPGTVGRVPQ